MKIRKNKPLILTMSIVLALVTILSATFAWFTSQDNVTNHLETGSLTNGDAKIVEIFDKDEPMNPGTSVDKFVGVVNTGSTEAFVRISFAEAIKKLANNGVATAATSKFTGATGTIPQLFDEKAIAAGGAYNGWTVLASGDANFESASLATFLGATTDIVVRYNKTVVGDKTYYQFVAYAPLGTLTGDAAKYSGLYQLVDINISVDKDKKLSIAGTIDYMQFAQTAETTARWAELIGHDPFETYTDKLNAPAITLPTATSHVDSMIKLIFGSNVKTNLASCNTGDWWYCSNDGYFYYIGKLSSGAQTASWLLEAVKLDEAAGDAYCNLSYDLTPCMDAIQAVKEALTSDAGWDLDSTTYAALIAKLTA